MPMLKTRFKRCAQVIETRQDVESCSPKALAWLPLLPFVGANRDGMTPLMRALEMFVAAGVQRPQQPASFDAMQYYPH